jgi:hypothetical protein
MTGWAQHGSRPSDMATIQTLLESQLVFLAAGPKFLIITIYLRQWFVVVVHLFFPQDNTGMGLKYPAIITA